MIHSVLFFTDCLHIELYRNCKDKFCNAQPRQVIVLQGYLGIESGFTLERESNTLAIICKEVIAVFCFDTREILHQWQSKLQCHFCKGKLCFGKSLSDRCQLIFANIRATLLGAHHCTATQKQVNLRSSATFIAKFYVLPCLGYSPKIARLLAFGTTSAFWFCRWKVLFRRRLTLWKRYVNI